MRLRTLAVLGAAAWGTSKLPRDPHAWPAAAGEQYALLREQLAEAVAAGRQAAERRMRQLDAEVAAALAPGAPPAR